MRQLLPLFTVLLVSIGTPSLYAQCPPLVSGQLQFNDDTDIANFAALYPDCSLIAGDLLLGDGTSVEAGITDLTPLAQLIEVTGDVLIGPQFSDLEGRGNLVTIGGSLRLLGNSNESDGNHPNVTTLANLNAELVIGQDLVITDLTALVELGNFNPSGVVNLTISNTGLTDCVTAGICGISGTLSLSNNGNGSGSCASVAALNAVCEQCDLGTGLLNVVVNQLELNELLGNIASAGCGTDLAGSLTINAVGSTIDLSGMSDITSIEGTLTLNGIANSDLSDLANLSVIGGLTISATTNLTTLDGLSGLTEINGDVLLTGNLQLENINEIADVTGVVNTTVNLNTALDDCAIASLCQSTGLTVVTANAINPLNPGNCSVTGFGPACNDLALPVELSSFTGNYDNKAVNLTWKTDAEQDNAGFSIQRSENGEIWSPIGFVSAAGIPEEYRFIDDNPTPGRNYYRLEQRDLDGTKQLSSVISVTVSHSDHIKVFPNPAMEVVNLRFANHLEAVVTVYNAAGQQELSTPVTGSQLAVDVASLSSGIYVLAITDERGTTTKRFTKQ